MKVVAIVGPTATGKTKLGVMIAEHFNGEVISADSMQIYEGMNIASAKPTAEEMCGIPHHLMGFVPQGEVFSVAKYVELAKQKIIEIHEKQKLPVIVGGTGLYIDSLLNNVEFVKTETDESLRKSLLESAEKNGAEYLWNQLNEIDPESAEKIEPNNIKRVARAIEIFKITGITISEQNRRSKMCSKWELLMRHESFLSTVLWEIPPKKLSVTKNLNRTLNMNFRSMLVWKLLNKKQEDMPNVSLLGLCVTKI